MDSIRVPADEGAAIVQRITSTNLVSIEAVVAQHLSSASFDVVVEAISLSAKTAGEADENVNEVKECVNHNFASSALLMIGAIICCSLTLCGCFYYFCCRNSS